MSYSRTCVPHEGQRLGGDARIETKSRQMPVHTSKQARRAIEQQTPMGSSDIIFSLDAQKLALALAAKAKG